MHQHKCRMLLVGKESRELKSLQVHLDKFGLQVNRVHDLRYAAAELWSGRPRILLLDVHDWKQAGLALVRGLRSSRLSASLRIVVLMSSPNLEEQIEAYRAGAEAVLPWPPPLRLLVSFLESLAWRDTCARVPLPSSTAMTSASGDELLCGALGEFTLPDLLQFLHFSQKSVWIDLANATLRGEIALRKGQLVYARTETATGEQALRELARWKSGRFSIKSIRFRLQQNISQPTMHLLLALYTNTPVPSQQKCKMIATTSGQKRR